MLQTEFIRSMNCNFERILLDEQPEERRYQYCILNRGGIKGLLSCSLRYLNGRAYLYYDITSKQNITQLYAKRFVTREWLRDFMWSLRQVRTELGRFLLDDRNILWEPEQIFQDLESNIFSFLYIPYYQGENTFLKLLEYLVERIDYEDEVLVECVYKMYEQCERNGEVYLQTQIFEDAKMLFEDEKGMEGEAGASKMEERKIKDEAELGESAMEPPEVPKKGIRYLLDGHRKKYKNAKADYQKNMQQEMEGYAVAEEICYKAEDCEEYGKTVYIEDSKALQEIPRRLYTTDGRIVMQVSSTSCVIGKKKEDADLVLDDFSVSRIHAKISREVDGIYIEDLNSTNGTYKNGLRMQPYEKRKLEEGDEIKIGKIVLLYR